MDFELQAKCKALLARHGFTLEEFILIDANNSAYPVGTFVLTVKYKSHTHYLKYIDWDGFCSRVDGLVSQYVPEMLRDICPALEQEALCPVADCQWGYGRLSALVMHLNDTPEGKWWEVYSPDAPDDHGWTRERIADWLETLDLDLTVGANDA